MAIAGRGRDCWDRRTQAPSDSEAKGEGKQYRKVGRKRLFLHFSQELRLAEWLYFCPTLAVTGPLGDLLFEAQFLVAPTPGLGDVKFICWPSL